MPMLKPLPVTFMVLALAGALAAQTKPARTSSHSSAVETQGPRGAGASAGGRQAALPAPATNLILMPGALPRATVMPQASFWQSRDLMAEMRNSARQGFIPVVPVDVTVGAVTDFAYFPSGWKAYAFAVPTRETLHVRLHHGHEGWFRLAMVDRWGRMTLGMMQNKIPTGNPEVTYKNLMKGPQVVYVIVDDPGWMSSKSDPYTLKIDRSWDAAKKPMSAIPSTLGVFATKKLAPDVEERADVPPPPVAAPPKS